MLSQTSEELLKDLSQHKVDLGFLCSWSIPSTKYNSVLLHQLPLTIVVYDSHPFANREVVYLHELSNQPFICIRPKNNHGGLDTFLQLCSYENFTPRFIEYTEDFRLMYLSVSQGHGITFNICTPFPSTYKNLRAIPVDISNYQSIFQSIGISAIWAKNYNECATPIIQFLDIYKLSQLNK